VPSAELGRLPRRIVREAFARYDAIQHERVRALRNLHRAVFAESLVASFLAGSELSPDPAHSFDISWPCGDKTVRVEVKCSGGYLPKYADRRETPPSWRFPIQKRVWDPTVGKLVSNTAYRFDVIVLARHAGSDLESGWSFHVLNVDEAVAVGGRATGQIAKRFPPVDGRDLEATVRDAFDRLHLPGVQAP
jgi:hypothetical protein